MTACKSSNDIPVGEYEGREYYRIRPEEKEFGRYPYVFRNFTPVLCMHCLDPPCINVCPITGGLYKREDGIVLVDEQKCDGCRQCIQACPYDAIYFRQDKGVIDKCTFCFDIVDEGSRPECAKTCPSNAIFFGDVDDRESNISKLIKEYDAKPLHPEFGTKPSVYYTTHAGRIKGTVLEKTSKLPLQGAVITLEGKKGKELFSTITSVDGVFFLWSLNLPMKYELEIEAEGYRSRKIHIDSSEEYVDLGEIEI
jgi:Fe-S-cluster-containing dehydrogenase component